MNPLTVVLSMLTATAVTGPFTVAAFVLGHYGWPAILLGVLLGVFGAAALARRIEYEMKRQDPAWDEDQDRPKAYAMVRPRSGESRDRVYSRSDRRH